MIAKNVDALVIGAGPAGVMAAAALHQRNLNVIVIEKQAFPRFVIGESLLPRCMEHFDETGFLDTLKKQGFQEKFGAKFIKDDRGCEFDFSEQYTKGWSWTWQVTRADFDKALADELENRGVQIHYKTTVKNVEFSGANSCTTIEDEHGVESTITAKFLVDASGYGRVLPRLLNLNVPSNQKIRHTLFTHIKDPARPCDDKNRILCIIPEQEVFIWVIPFSNGLTSVGFVGRPEYFEQYEGDTCDRLKKMIAAIPQISGRFSNSEFIFEPKEIKGFSMGVKQLYGEGFVLTGNASEFIDPIFSSGVTLATETGLLAGKLVSRQLKGDQVDWQKEYEDYILSGVDTFRTYVSAWYDGTLQDIFFSSRTDDDIRKQICSVLAGYVWDYTNPFVRKKDQVLKSLVKVIRMDTESYVKKRGDVILFLWIFVKLLLVSTATINW